MLNPPKQNSVSYPEVNLFLPYVKVYPTTLISLIGYNYQPVLTRGKDGYSNYFKTRWEEGKTFVNVEQDIVVHPRAIREIWDCSHDWCGFDFHLPNHQLRNLEEEYTGVPIGCVKITNCAIEQTFGIWDNPVEWVMCEQNITKSFVAAGIPFHQHHPGVVNANKEFLKFLI